MRYLLRSSYAVFDMCEYLRYEIGEREKQK